MSKITIVIEHNLTPFNKEKAEVMLDVMLKALENFWGFKSKKLFKIDITKE